MVHSENIFVIQHRIATTTSSKAYMSVYNCNYHCPSQTAFLCSAITASISFISVRLLTAPLCKALLFASNVSCDVFSALSACLFASSSIADASISKCLCLLTSSCNSRALRFCCEMLALFTHDAITHPGLFRLTFGGGRDANLWDHSDPVYPSCIIWSDSYSADMLTYEIIVILFTDIAHEIITCQRLATQSPGFPGEVLNPRSFPGFFTSLNIPGFFQVSWSSRLL